MPNTAEEKDVPLPKKIMEMGMSEKIGLALTGDKEARTLLAREPNKLILNYLLQNPRITENEIIQLAKVKTIPQEILITISKRREWMKKYQLRLALTENPKTPLPLVLKLLSLLRDVDLRKIARSRDVSANVSAGARRLLMSRGLL